jgi:hypothetical protein
VWATLAAFGLAVGLTAIDPQDPTSLRASGIFTGVWGVIAPLLALFIGGLVAGRGTPDYTRSGGVLHGVVMWSITMLVGAWLLGNLLGAVVGGVFSMGKTAAQAGGSAIAGAVGGGNLSQIGGAFGLDANDALAPINQRLQAEGKPTVTPDQLQAAVGDVVSDALRQGQLDRQLIVQSLAQKTALSQQDAQEVAMRIERQYNAFTERASGMLAEVQTQALAAAEQTGKAFWGVFFALLLGLGAAIGGAVLTVPKPGKYEAAAAVPPPA